MQQITRKLMITLVLLMTAAAGAWATIYTGPVAITSLQVGDIFAPGFSLTGDNSKSIHFDGGRHKYGGTPSTEETATNLGDIVSINALCVIKTEHNVFSPSDENENDVYAWKVTQVSSSGIWLSGIYYPAAIPTETANQWQLKMPAGNVKLTVAYKDRTQMALAYGGTAITATANAVTAFKGCEQEFATTLTAELKNIESGTAVALDPAPTLAADFTFKSSDATIIGFKKDETYVAEGTLDQMAFLDLTAENTPVELTVTYKGTDDLESKSQALLVTITEKTYAVKMAEPTDAEAANWTIAKGNSSVTGDVAEGLTGLKAGDEGVTLTYGGRMKVKAVTATIDAAPAEALIVKPEVGQYIGSDGKNYAANATLPDGVTKVAKICYVGSETGEAAPYNHGLALALSDANGGTACKWKKENTDAGHTKQTSSTFTEESGLQYNDATHNSATYPAFKAAIANNGSAAPEGCSAWFLTSGYQWQKMIVAAGLSNLGLQANAKYWSSSETNQSDRAYYLNLISDNWSTGAKDRGNQVRACLAFYPPSSEIYK